MKYLNHNGATTIYVAIIVTLLILINSCAPITAAQHGKLVSYEKKFHSTYFVVTVRGADSCSEYVSYWNSNCWQCKDANVPQNWDIVKTTKGYYIKPVK